MQLQIIKYSNWYSLRLLIFIAYFRCFVEQFAFPIALCTCALTSILLSLLLHSYTNFFFLLLLYCSLILFIIFITVIVFPHCYIATLFVHLWTKIFFPTKTFIDKRHYFVMARTKLWLFKFLWTLTASRKINLTHITNLLMKMLNIFILCAIKIFIHQYPDITERWNIYVNIDLNWHSQCAEVSHIVAQIANCIFLVAIKLHRKLSKSFCWQFSSNFRILYSDLVAVYEKRYRDSRAISLALH